MRWPDVAQQAVDDLCGAKLCEINSMSSRREMIRLVDLAITGLRAALAQQTEPKSCTWYQDGDSDSGTYSTSCGHYFDLTDGTPEDNEMSHCCYCGNQLAQELIAEDEDA